MNWTATQVAEIKTYIDGGKSRSEVANLYGVSRNAIVGIVWRSGIRGPLQAQKVAAIITNERKRKEKKPFALRPVAKNRKPPVLDFEPRPDEPEPLRVSLLDLEDSHCKWLCEGTDNHCLPTYCGHPSIKGRWCAHHYARVYAR